MIFSLRNMSNVFVLLLALAYLPMAHAEEGHADHDEHSAHGGEDAHGDHGDHDEHAEGEEATKGPHGGRLLTDGDFQLELAIFEDGVPPEFHVWLYEHGKPVTAADAVIRVSLARLGGAVDTIEFSAAEGFWRGQQEVTEPHSFDVTVTALYEGKQRKWQFESYEGRVTLKPEQVKTNGIGTAIAGPGTIHETVLLYGKLVADPHAISHIRARYPGMIKRAAYKLGDHVNAGDVLFDIESNDSLAVYSVRSPIAGTVVASDAHAGEFADDQVLLTIADYSHLLLELGVFQGDVGKVQKGQTVEMRLGDERIPGQIEYTGTGAAASPPVYAYVPLDNSTGRWVPGLTAEGSVTVTQQDVALRVENRALQTFRDWTVVFIQMGNDFEIRPVELGKTDGQFTEVLSGLEPGSRYVVENSYLLKADLEKSGAAHDH